MVAQPTKRVVKRGTSAPPLPALPFDPTNMFQMFVGVQVPDPITFVTGAQWLNRPNLYPRQGTLLKIIFLRTDLLTEYDHTVIDEWEQSYRATGNNGIVPGVRQRMDMLREDGYDWFREVLLVMGRRAGKGHITALSKAYVLWNYMAKGDPQNYFGVDRDKRLACLVFAGKRDQAKATVFGDLVNVITSSECFAPYISQSLTEKLTVYAPHDFVRMRKMSQKGINTQRDMATFEILPKESTPMAGRGPTSFMLAFDEQAHVTASGTAASADAVYDSSKPSTDQFGKSAFIVAPSSPWQMMGKFYENYLEATTLNDDGTPKRPNYLMIQLASWDIYKDWERAHEIEMFPSDFTGDLDEYVGSYEPPHYQRLRGGAIQVYDDEMVREEQANPETFAVERRAHWANALDAYLNPKKVEAVFQPWDERPAKYGPPQITEQSTGIMVLSYKGHADPSKVNDKFGWALAHTEYDEQGRAHAVFDKIGHFDPQDFPNSIIDYEYVDEWLWDNVIKPFMPDEFTFDQFNSAASIQRLQKLVRHAGLPKHVELFEKTATRPYDWKVKENTKAAINLGLVHAPFNERLRDELKFLQYVNGRVDHPNAGPVQSKDIADAFCEVVHVLIGEQTQNLIHPDLNGLKPAMNTMGIPFPGMGGGDNMPQHDRERLQAMSGFSRARGNMDGQFSRGRRRRY